MKRDLSSLSQGAYDIIVIGGGANGAACAWDAALRGMSVAVLERDDFGASTSANSAKIAHSGIRYLQHADFGRMRQSVHERNLLVRNAPYLVNAQPVLLPVYGHGLKGREFMTLYLKAYDLLSLDRKAFKDPARRIPDARMLSKAEVLEIAPLVNPENLTGGAVWYEGQIHNTERLLMAVIRAAESRGARFANYAEVTRVAVEGDRVTGVEAVDQQTGRSFSVSGKVVINASGPWLNETLRLTGRIERKYVNGSKAFSLLTRPLGDTHVLSFSTRPMYRDRKALLDKGSSLHFVIPWRGHSLIGSLHLACDDDPQNVGISEHEIGTYLDMINEGYPAARLQRQDVKRVLWGMIPGEVAGEAAPEKHHKLIDHAREDGLEGLVSMEGVKLTTSRHVASETIDLVCSKLGRRGTRSLTASTPVWGGEIEYLHAFIRDGLTELGDLPEPVARRLLLTYGAQFRAVLDVAAMRPELMEPLPDSLVLKAEIVHAVRDEMALRLQDVVLRRTDLGSLQHPGEESLRACAELMAQELNWDDRRIARELETVTEFSGYFGGHAPVESHAA